MGAVDEKGVSGFLVVFLISIPSVVDAGGKPSHFNLGVVTGYVVALTELKDGNEPYLTETTLKFKPRIQAGFKFGIQVYSKGDFFTIDVGFSLLLDFQDNIEACVGGSCRTEQSSPLYYILQVYPAMTLNLFPIKGALSFYFELGLGSAYLFPSSKKCGAGEDLHTKLPTWALAMRPSLGLRAIQKNGLQVILEPLSIGVFIPATQGDGMELIGNQVSYEVRLIVGYAR
jgi:hypothetical protein